MRLQLRLRNVRLTKALRAHVERSLGFALSRFGEQVQRVTVRLTGSRTLPMRCEIEVGLRPRSVLAEDSDVDLLAAIDQAVRRASRSVARLLRSEPSAALGE